MIAGLSSIASLGADDLWIIATAACCAIVCGVLGCFLVLQRLSLLGDAMSHAILPGLAVAFIVSGSRSVPIMLLGAGAAALVTVALSGGLRRIGRVREDAALGVVFTSLFALGVLLITWVASRVDLDPGCVLYGLLELVPFDTVTVAGLELPRAFLWLAALLAVVVVLVALFFKELRIVCFDPGLATSLGISAAAVNAALLALVAAATVVSFEAVGSILVVAVLVGPAATAQLLTDRLSRMPWIAAGLGLISAVVGYLLALRWNTSVAGMMSVVLGGAFLLAALLAPRHGYLVRRSHRWLLALRIAREDLLSDLYREHEVHTGTVRAASERTHPVARPWLRRLVRQLLLWQGFVERAAEPSGGPGTNPASKAVVGRLMLTARGLESGRELVRKHRLWETYLARDLGLPADHLHAPAHREEHFIAGELLEVLEREVEVGVDPHGRPIPGRMASTVEHPSMRRPGSV